MKYCIVDTKGIIVNIVICEDNFAKEINAKPYYNNARIGDVYIQPLSIEERLDRIEKQLGIK